MSTRGLLFDWASTIKNQLNMLVYYKTDIIIRSSNETCSRHDIAELFVYWLNYKLNNAEINFQNVIKINNSYIHNESVIDEMYTVIQMNTLFRNQIYHYFDIFILPWWDNNSWRL
jgi:hypothetical protein